MKFLMTANKRYISYLEVAERILKKYKYDGPLLYDMGGLGRGIKWEYEPDLRLPAVKNILLQKPRIMQQVQPTLSEPLVFMDADAFLNGRIDEILDFDWDVGVTYKGSATGGGVVNSGVIFFRPTSKASDFLDRWVDFIDAHMDEYLERFPMRRIGDQIFLNKYIDQYVPRGVKKLNETKVVAGTKVRFFDAKIYNNPWIIFDSSIPNDVKIVHFCGGAGTVRKKCSFLSKVKMWNI